MSPANILDMPLGEEKLHFIQYAKLARATYDDVKAVAKIQREEKSLGKTF
jgi:hypothetical protein